MLQPGTGGRSVLIFSARFDTLNPDKFQMSFNASKSAFQWYAKQVYAGQFFSFSFKIFCISAVYLLWHGFSAFLIKRGCVGIWQKKTGPLTTWSFIKRFISGSVRSETCNTVIVIRQLWLPTSGMFYGFIIDATNTPFLQGSSGRSPRGFTAFSSNRENPLIYLFYQ